MVVDFFSKDFSCLLTYTLFQYQLIILNFKCCTCFFIYLVLFYFYSIRSNQTASLLLYPHPHQISNYFVCVGKQINKKKHGKNSHFIFSSTFLKFASLSACLNSRIYDKWKLILPSIQAIFNLVRIVSRLEYSGSFK